MQAGQPELRVYEVPTGELVPYAGNAKEHPDWQVGQIVASIERFGFSDPVGVWHDPDGRPVIVEGHGRVMAAKELGMESVPCVALDHLDDEGRRAYALAHNQLTMNSGWDDLALSDELADLADMDMGDFGFDVGGEVADAADVAEVDVPEDVTAVCGRGQVWRLGRHRLMCGDSTSADDVDRLMGGQMADMLLTDPPYNVALGQHMRPSEAKQLRRRTDGLVIDNDSFDTNEAFIDFLTDAFVPAMGHLAGGGAFYIWHASNQTHNFRAACSRASMEVRQILVWVKNTFALGRQDYQWRHELCLYGWKGGAAHHWYGDRRQSTVLEYNKPSRNEQHPTMKPVALVARLMENSSAEGDVVMDVFGGSGTTLVAAEQLGRTCYMMELDPHYCDVIIARWEELTGGKAERVE